jgi:hypothetical protein
VAGLVYVVVSGIFTFVKYDILHKILPPHVTGPIIILIGMSLAPVAISNATTNWTIAIITFATGVFVKIGFDRMGFKFLSLLPVLFALIVGYVVSLIVGAVDFSTVNAANWVGLPAFMLPKFAGGAMVLIVPVALVTMVEHFGDVIAIGNVVKKDFLKDPGVNRTLLGDGLATSLSALIGGPANTTYSENTGAVALTGVYNPAVMRIAAVFAIILSVIPKFTALIGTIPRRRHRRHLDPPLRYDLCDRYPQHGRSPGRHGPAPAADHRRGDARAWPRRRRVQPRTGYVLRSRPLGDRRNRAQPPDQLQEFQERLTDPCLSGSAPPGSKCAGWGFFWSTRQRRPLTR